MCLCRTTSVSTNCSRRKLISKLDSLREQLLLLLLLLLLKYSHVFTSSFVEVTATTLKMAVFWVVVPCRLDKFTRVSEVCTASIIMAMCFTLMMEAVWTSKNAGKLLSVCTMPHPRRQPSSYSPP
jgi:hypothetical protein